MKHNSFIKCLTSALLVIVLLLGALPTALASCPMSDTGEHSWGGWTTRTSATCTRDGERVRTCVNCGATETETIGKSGHSYGKWKTVKEATCTENGKRQRKCSNCGHKDTETTKKKHHTWGEWTVITEPTDCTTGVREHTCTVCGTTHQEEFYPEGTLQKGDKGDDVRTLQELLNENGFDCGKADGIFGKKTEAAVKQVEIEIQIEPDGIAWPAIIEKLQPKQDTAASASYTRAPATGDTGNTVDAEVQTPYIDAEAENTGALTLSVEIASQQFPNKEGDTIEFAWTLTNNTGFKLSNCDIRLTGMFGEQGFYALEEESIDIGAAVNGIYSYTVTANDITFAQKSENGNSVLHYRLWAYGDYADSETALSNDVHLTTEAIGTPDRPILDNGYGVLEKWEESAPLNGEYYVEGETVTYGIRLNNTDKWDGGRVMRYVQIFDESCLVEADMLVGESVLETTMTHIVTAEDAERGYIENTAYATWEQGGFLGWVDESECGWCRVDSNTVTVYTAPTAADASLEKWEESSPANGVYYEEGETVTYGLRIVNNTTETMYSAEIFDELLQDSPEGCLAEADPVAPGSTWETTADYVVTAEDVQQGSIVNSAMVTWNSSAQVGGTEDWFTAHSNTVTVYTAPKGEEAVYLEKVLQYAPLNGDWYVPGEPIWYFLRLHNESDGVLTDVEICDPLKGFNEDALVARAEMVEPGGTLEGYFAYMVTQDDVVEGEIANQACAYWNGDRSVLSDTVIAATGNPKAKRYITLTDTAHVGEAYQRDFELLSLIEGPHSVVCPPIESGSDLGELGMDCMGDAVDSGAYITITGTPEQTGSGSCVYTMVVDDETWVIEVDITVN